MYLCSDVFDGLVVCHVLLPSLLYQVACGAHHVTVVFSPGRQQEKPQSFISLLLVA
jgi:hypothetical protein